MLSSVSANPKVSNLIVAAAVAGLKSANQITKGVRVKIASSLSTYASYLEQTYRHVSTIKTFIDPTKPVSLLDSFVPPSLEVSNIENFGHEEIIENIKNGKRFVITGLAGYGKSVLTKYIALCLYENPQGVIPFFIELKELNRLTNPNILSFIQSTYSVGNRVDKEVFTLSLSQGMFTLILDGFDELNHDIRLDIERQLHDIAEKYPKCSLIISSRPDQKFDGWRTFHTCRVKQMNLSQVQGLIKKLDYDAPIKKRFLAKLPSLFTEHESFLSTPLLATLMLLMYRDNANIPAKLHLFYDRAFETLFEKHDTYKDGYIRQRRVDIRIDQFASIFSVFCINTYVSHQLEFSKSEILPIIDDAISYTSLQINSEDFLHDLVESVCLLQIEGNTYSFVHRSFQEYFTAFFLANCPDQIRNEFLDEGIGDRSVDLVLRMLFDMSQDRIEAGWVLPALQEVKSSVENSKVSTGVALFCLSWDEVHLVCREGKWGFARFRPGPLLHKINAIASFYSEKIQSNYLDVGIVNYISEEACKKNSLKFFDIFSSLSEMTDYKNIKGRKNFPISSIGLSGNSTEIRRFSKAYKEMLGVLESLDDHKVVRQEFLKRLKAASN